ncbi:receptor kinase-like protein Xa21 [Salvia splendens]|uniref:receptor kinase-like protein Xa21 n=1 Tax=Salvia splendens TaxID=180675 RepID=UPI001C27AFCB|nr:receptor kinase-like protein Xa21 [Salvia splendens]
MSGVLPTNLCHTSPSLKELYLGMNSISGLIPNSIPNCSQLTILSIGDNKFSGYIPTDLGNLRLLESIRLLSNNLTNAPSSPNMGFLTSLSNCRSLTHLSISDNPLYGVIPSSVGNLSSLLERFSAGRCKLNGTIPDQIGDLIGLTVLALDENELSGNIPLSIKHLHKLERLYLVDNMLQGPILKMSNLGAAISRDLSMNQLSGSIASSIGKLQSLANLSLANNSLEGSIPVSMGNMISLVTLDLSHNNLSGSIPKSLEALQHLNYFNVSFNNLSGEIPSGGSFKIFTVDSFKGNVALCGIPRFHVPICPDVSDHRLKRKKKVQVLFIAFGVVAFISIVCLAFIFVRYKRKDKKVREVVEMISIVPERISYYELMQATEQFSESNLLGTGSSCSVYKGILNNGKVIAVKVFNLHLEGISKIFDVECEILCSIRHRCLNSVISCCSKEEFKALVREYMPNGNLEKWLHSDNYFLNFMERLNIMINVASALEYLHGGYSAPIVHFGIAKLLCDGDSMVLTNTLGTLGYIAPEYGSEGVVSTRCDVYSYGVMLMEVFTRKKPSDNMFVGDLSLKTWIERLVPEFTYQVIDANLVMNVDEEQGDKIVDFTSSISELALKCCADPSYERTTKKDALAELQKV